MELLSDIVDIKTGMREGRYKNEAAVSQGIILRILNTLGWPIFDSSKVIPEYSVGNGRVDYALCHPPGKPIILLESKAHGEAQGSERQLFEYAFHQGIPMAVLTDGQEWSFFLPGEQGAYHERCVYKLDLNARATDECCRIFERYLNHTEVMSGAAVNNARTDYKNVSKEREIQNTLPKAWHQLLEEKDEILIELVADKVESLCGFKPVIDAVEQFLDTIKQGLNTGLTTRINVQPIPSYKVENRHPAIENDDFSGFVFQGQNFKERNAIETLFKVFEIFTKSDPDFLKRYAALPKHGNKRRYLSLSKMELYPGRPDLCEKYSKQKFNEWWIGTNYSRNTIRHAIKLACEVAGVQYGTELKLI